MQRFCKLDFEFVTGKQFRNSLLENSQEPYRLNILLGLTKPVKHLNTCKFWKSLILILFYTEEKVHEDLSESAHHNHTTEECNKILSIIVKLTNVLDKALIPDAYYWEKWCTLLFPTKCTKVMNTAFMNIQTQTLHQLQGEKYWLKIYQQAEACLKSYVYSSSP